MDIERRRVTRDDVVVSGRTRRAALGRDGQVTHRDIVVFQRHGDRAGGRTGPRPDLLARDRVQPDLLRGRRHEQGRGCQRLVLEAGKAGILLLRQAGQVRPRRTIGAEAHGRDMRSGNIACVRRARPLAAQQRAEILCLAKPCRCHAVVVRRQRVGVGTERGAELGVPRHAVVGDVAHPVVRAAQAEAGHVGQGRRGLVVGINQESRGIAGDGDIDGGRRGAVLPHGIQRLDMEFPSAHGHLIGDQRQGIHAIHHLGGFPRATRAAVPHLIAPDVDIDGRLPRQIDAPARLETRQQRHVAGRRELAHRRDAGIGPRAHRARAAGNADAHLIGHQFLHRRRGPLDLPGQAATQQHAAAPHLDLGLVRVRVGRWRRPRGTDAAGIITVLELIKLLDGRQPGQGRR